MTHREPDQSNWFYAVTMWLFMTILSTAVIGILGYGAWMIADAVAQALTQVFA